MFEYKGHQEAIFPYYYFIKWIHIRPVLCLVDWQCLEELDTQIISPLHVIMVYHAWTFGTSKVSFQIQI